LPLGGKRLIQDATGYVATIKRGQIVSENGSATGALPGNLIRGKQTCEAKSEISKVSLFDRTIRLSLIKLAQLYWKFNKKTVKSTIVSSS
jgi:hypothetical protein